MTARVFLTSYGGGHATIIGALVPALQSQDFATDVIGLTTAHALLHRLGVKAKSVEALLVAEEDEKWLCYAEEFAQETGHPDITEKQTRAYFALGLRDLARDIGVQAALETARERGRVAFCPVDAFKRYFAKTKPDLVITSTSPRFERAAQRAAHAEGIPSLAIGDLFVEHERDWILEPDYGEYLAVLSQPVVTSMVDAGFSAKHIRATGNPAFDGLVASANNLARRDELRARYNIGERRLILCPVASASHAKNGQPLLEPVVFARHMERFCQSRNEYTYMMRAHPNAPFDLPADCRSGFKPNTDAMSVEDAILMSDIVVVEVSTVGLQAALMGKAVICVGFADHAVYPKYGLAHIADTIDDAFTKLDDAEPLSLEALGMPPLGTATGNVIQFVRDILDQAQMA